jgi:hypothetical protein
MVNYILVSSVKMNEEFFDQVAASMSVKAGGVGQMPLPNDPKAREEIRRRAREFIETYFPVGNVDDKS